jgi:hypothetical protein
LVVERLTTQSGVYLYLYSCIQHFDWKKYFKSFLGLKGRLILVVVILYAHPLISAYSTDKLYVACLEFMGKKGPI